MAISGSAGPGYVWQAGRPAAAPKRGQPKYKALGARQLVP